MRPCTSFHLFAGLPAVSVQSRSRRPQSTVCNETALLCRRRRVGSGGWVWKAKGELEEREKLTGQVGNPSLTAAFCSLPSAVGPVVDGYAFVWGVMCGLGLFTHLLKSMRYSFWGLIVRAEKSASLQAGALPRLCAQSCATQYWASHGRLTRTHSAPHSPAPPSHGRGPHRDEPVASLRAHSVKTELMHGFSPSNKMEEPLVCMEHLSPSCIFCLLPLKHLFVFSPKSALGPVGSHGFP